MTRSSGEVQSDLIDSDIFDPQTEQAVQHLMLN